MRTMNVRRVLLAFAVVGRFCRKFPQWTIGVQEVGLAFSARE
jgi:membrane protein required for beta-lactamase induction